MMRWLGWLAVIAAVLGAVLWGVNRATTERLPDIAVRPPAGTAPAHRDTTSEINLQIALALPALQALIEAQVPRSFAGEMADPTGLLGDAHAKWQLNRGPVTLTPTPDGRLAFSAPIIDSSATLTGRINAGSEGRGLLGRMQAVLGQPFEQTVAFSGTISGTIAPQLRPDWTVEPNLDINVAFDKAEAQLFALPLRVSFAEQAESMITASLRTATAALDAQLRRDQRLRTAAAAGWAQLAGSHQLSGAPPAWLGLQPRSIAISAPATDAQFVSVSLVAGVDADVQLGGAAPAVTPTPLPALGSAIAAPGRFRVAVPVAVKLADLAAVAGDPDFKLGARTVSIRNIALNGDGGAVIIAADVDAATGRWLGGVSGRLYLQGTPVLDMANARLSFTNLRYTVATQSMLTRSASWLLQPVVLQQLRRRAVFDMPGGRDGVIAAANARIAPLTAALPAGTSTNLALEQLDAADLSIDDGWLTLFVSASGPATLRVDSTAALMGTRP